MVLLQRDVLVLRTGEGKGNSFKDPSSVALELAGPCRSLLIRPQIERSYKGFSGESFLPVCPSVCLSVSQSGENKADQELELG